MFLLHRKQYGNIRKSWASSRALNNCHNSREARSTGRERNKNYNNKINNGFQTNYGHKLGLITNRPEQTIMPDTSNVPFPSMIILSKIYRWAWKRVRSSTI